MVLSSLGSSLFRYLDRLLQEPTKDQEEKYSSSYSKVDQIELKHVKVESGFVYILSNELMPNIYKVGFTARNPDERSVEITSKSGLPKPFKVEK